MSKYFKSAYIFVCGSDIKLTTEIEINVDFALLLKEGDTIMFPENPNNHEFKWIKSTDEYFTELGDWCLTVEDRLIVGDMIQINAVYS